MVDRVDGYFQRMLDKFGSIEDLINDFFQKRTVEKILEMPSGSQKSSSITGALTILSGMFNRTENRELKLKIQNAVKKLISKESASAAGGKRKHKTRRRKRRL